MGRLPIVVAALSAGLILAVLLGVRRAHIRVEYSVAWLLAGVLLLALSLSESALRWAGTLLGSSDPTAALLVVCGGIFVVVLYRSSLRISGLKDANIALAQRVAILEFRLESLDEKIKAEKPA
jgi:hypothetical protein